MGRPDDIAGAAVFLASDESAYITAQTLNVDGGNVNELIGSRRSWKYLRHACPGPFASTQSRRASGSPSWNTTTRAAPRSATSRRSRPASSAASITVFRRRLRAGTITRSTSCTHRRDSGKAFVGDWIGQFEPGHLVLTGPRLPHNWISLDVPEAALRCATV